MSKSLKRIEELEKMILTNVKRLDDVKLDQFIKNKQITIIDYDKIGEIIEGLKPISKKSLKQPDTPQTIKWPEDSITYTDSRELVIISSNKLELRVYDKSYSTYKRDYKIWDIKSFILKCDVRNYPILLDMIVDSMLKQMTIEYHLEKEREERIEIMNKTLNFICN